MAQGTYRGTYESSDSRAAAQARAMGAKIGDDGWWYKDGRKLSHNEADALANSTGKAVDNAHQQWGTGGFIDRNRDSVGNFLQNAAPIAGVLTGGLGGIALGGLGAALGAGARRGTNIGNIVRTGVDNAMVTSAGQNLASQFGYKGPMSAAKIAPVGKATAETAAAAVGDPSFAVDELGSLGRERAFENLGLKRPVGNVFDALGGTTVPGIPGDGNTPRDWGGTMLNAGKTAYGFLKDNSTATKGMFDYLSGATKQQGQINEAKLQEILLGNEAAALEKRRKKQMGEMLAQLFASGYFGNSSGSSTPR